MQAMFAQLPAMVSSRDVDLDNDNHHKDEDDKDDHEDGDDEDDHEDEDDKSMIWCNLKS